MQQLCRIAATMAQTVPLTFDGDSDEQTARSGLWRFAAPEYYALALAISIGIATYIFVTGDAQSERLLTPALVAAIMVANLVRSEEHTSELQSLMRISYAVFCLKKKKQNHNITK